MCWLWGLFPSHAEYGVGEGGELRRVNMMVKVSCVWDRLSLPLWREPNLDHPSVTQVAPSWCTRAKVVYNLQPRILVSELKSSSIPLQLFTKNQIFKLHIFIMAPSAISNETATNGSQKLNFDTFQNVINGKLVSSGKTRRGVNPANKKELWEVPVATEQDLDDAVNAGRAAFKKWKNVPYAERSKAIIAFADALESHKSEFSKLLTTEQGKPASIN